MTALAYCPVCRKDVEFTSKDRIAVTNLKGTDYSYPVKDAVCNVCGAIATYAPFQKEAAASFDDAVRAAEGIVDLETIRDMPKRYRIGKRPLSQLLGWGEITYSRFVEGAVPSRDYSDTIKKYYDDPVAFLQLLKARRDRLTDSAFRKSSEALKAIIDEHYPDAVRIYEVAARLSALASGDITNKALQKLVYYAQGFSTALLPKPIFQQSPRAWAAGPVYGQLWHEIHDNKEAFLSDCEEESPFSRDEEALIQAVYDAFGKYSGPMLSKLTHEEAPWLNARKRAGVAEGKPADEPIPLEEMERFFQGVAKQYKIRSVDDIANYPKAVLDDR